MQYKIKSGISDAGLSSLPMSKKMLDVPFSPEDKTAVRLVLMAATGLVVAAAAGFISWFTAGPFISFLMIGAVLVVTALILYRATSLLDQQSSVAQTAIVPAGFISVFPQPSLSINRSGKVIQANRHALAMSMKIGWNLMQELPYGQRDFLQTAIQRTQQFPDQSSQLTMTLLDKNWSVSCIGAGDEIILILDPLKDPISGISETLADVSWLEPVLTVLRAGLMLKASGRDFLFVSDQVREWMRAAGVDEPALDAITLTQDEQALMVPHGPKIPVQVAEFPIDGITGTKAVSDGKKAQGGSLYLIRRQEDEIALSGSKGTSLLDPLFDEAPMAVALVDGDARVLEYSKGLQNFSNHRDKSLRGFDVTRIVGPEEREVFKETIGRIAETGQFSNPIDVHFAQTEDRLGQISFVSLMVAGSRKVVLFIVDRTQEKSLERQFVQAQKMQAVGQLAGGVAHDFNNILTAILGFCDLLLSRYETGDQSFSDLMQIKQNANRAASLVRQLLAFSRQQTMRPRVLFITDVLSEISNLLRRLIGEKIDLRIRHGRNLAPVKIDPGQMDQVIINLAVNARDAMEDGGFLDIETKMVKKGDELFTRYQMMVPQDYLCLTITDTGSGIPEDVRQKIFEPFFTTKPVGQGTGLGLATVYGIIKQLSGYVFVTSKVGEGTSFIVLLPAQDSKTEPVEEEVVVDTKDLAGTATILLVEDEEPVRLLTARALAARGYEVLEATSGDAALSLLEENPNQRPDLLISDVVMPNMDGPTLLKNLRDQDMDMPVIMISGYAEDVVRRDLEDDSVRFLQKPFELKTLSELVKLSLSSS